MWNLQSRLRNWLRKIPSVNDSSCEEKVCILLDESSKVAQRAAKMQSPVRAQHTACTACFPQCLKEYVLRQCTARISVTYRDLAGFIYLVWPFTTLQFAAIAHADYCKQRMKLIYELAGGVGGCIDYPLISLFAAVISLLNVATVRSSPLSLFIIDFNKNAFACWLCMPPPLLILLVSSSSASRPALKMRSHHSQCICRRNIMPDKGFICLSLQIMERTNITACFSSFLLTHLPVRTCSERIVWRLSRHKTCLVIYTPHYVIPS